MTSAALRLAPLSLVLVSLAAGCGDSDASYTGGEALSGGDEGFGSAGDSAGDPGGGEGGGEGGEGGGEPGQLTAGEWRDLDHWDFWLDLLAKAELAELEGRWGFFTEQRFSVHVSGDGVPLADAGVVLLGPGAEPLWSARTDVHGEAELFAGLFSAPPEGPFSIEVSTSAGKTVVAEVKAGGAEPIEVETGGTSPKKTLDLMYVIDTTGSMGDELSYLQTELADVVDRVRTEVGDAVDMRLSVNFYRDVDDEYVVRPFAFTTDVDQAIADLNQQSAGGGGDWPEAVHSALADAIDEHAWRESATARLCFLVLDAPPHEEEAVLAAARESVRRFAARGVRIVPIAASGVDQATEFMLRYYAISTGGTYTFLTDHSGLGGDHLEPTIGEYQVEHLNDLMVRLIIGALTP